MHALSNLTSTHTLPPSYSYAGSLNPIFSYANILLKQCAEPYVPFIRANPCNIIPWIGPGHAFIEIECLDKFSRTYGMYPYEEQDIEGGDKALDREDNKFGSPRYNIIAAKGFTPPLQTGGSSSLGVRRFTSTGSSTGGNYFKSSLITESASKLSLAPPFWEWLTAKTSGIISNDDGALISCRHKLVPCLYTKIPLKMEDAEDLNEKLHRMKIESQEFARNKTLSPKYVYKLFESNCVDFVRKTIKQHTELDWQSRVIPTMKFGSLEKVLAFAWHYFHWTSN